MRAKVCKLANGITLIGIGVVLLDFYFTGRIDRYLHPQFRLCTLIGGIIFCLAGIIYAGAKTRTECCVEGECVHRNSNSELRSAVAFALLFVPLAAGVALSRDSYDAQAILNRGFVADVNTLPGKPSVGAQPPANNQVIPPQALGADNDENASEPLPQNTPDSQSDPNSTQTVGTDQANPNVPSPNEGSADYLPKAPDGNVALEVTDLLYGESEESLRKLFVDKTIEVVGQYLPGSGAGQFKLVRMFIWCCAADARPIAVPVLISAPPGATEMAWVRVTGKATYARNGDRIHVQLKADKVEATDPPAEAMLY
ncbi:MAG TPA: TIGR03943 family protein [Chthoniobacterales bacterium]|nr:TIGR03943 family protein [Chthoniobacterales bacterium]